MKTAEGLRAALRAIDHRSYPAYKSLAGSWSFGNYVLNIEHVQGDPFAAPSQLSVAVDARTAGFPSRCWDTRWNRAALESRPAPALSAPGFHLPAGKRVIDLPGATQTRKNYRGDGFRQERLKVKRFGKTAFSVGGRELDLRYVEQLVDGGQTQALAYMVRYARENLAGRDVGAVVSVLLRVMDEDGLGAVCGGGVVPAGLALPRAQEIFACFDRY